MVQGGEWDKSPFGTWDTFREALQVFPTKHSIAILFDNRQVTLLSVGTRKRSGEESSHRQSARATVEQMQSQRGHLRAEFSGIVVIPSHGEWVVIAPGRTAFWQERLSQADRSPASRYAKEEAIRPPSFPSSGSFQVAAIRTAVLCLLLTMIGIDGVEVSGAEESVDFARQIRPILSENCFACHGFDPSSRKAELRLDEREAALAPHEGHSAIVPGNSRESEVWKRILSTDSDEQMPPPTSGKTLNAAQKDLLKRWIDQGAPYAPHWAFSRVESPNVPRTVGEISANAIDAFVVNKLHTHQLSLSPEADRVTLIRRLSQDLLGLQPTPEEADAFSADQSPDAYEKLVDRLLQSPHYGERWGRHWLDQARYADSNGYTIDGPRIMWPYRDWVIDAVNRDLPFDQFTIEQLAGDQLPESTKFQQIATGFHRNTLINQEGGVKPDQYRHEAIIDRVNTTGAVWLGLTVGCAQCHTHKYDPLSHHEYYQLYAFFNQCDDANNEATTVPVLEHEVYGWNAEQLAKLEELKTLRTQMTELDRQLAASKSTNLLAHEWNWMPAELLNYITLGMGDFLRQPDGSLLSDLKAQPNDTYQVNIKSPGERITAIRLRVLPHESLPMNGPGLASNGNFVLTDAQVKVGDKVTRFVAAAADHSQPEYDVLNVIDDQPTTGWALNVSDEQKKTHPELAMNAPHEAVFVLAAPVAKVEAVLFLKHDVNQGYLIGRFAIDVSDVLPPVNESAEIQAQIASLKKQAEQLESQLPGGGRTVNQMVMRDTEAKRDTFRLDRGDFLTPDTAAGPLTTAVPAALVVGAAPDFKTRLDLARWLVSRDNPLTARVIVNRVWMRYFGRGLVETENDFGAQGTPPTHPELLDWLAAEFMETGWSMKQLHRQIVTSKAYQQSSVEHPEAVTIDPRNVWLGRQSRVRVDAEIVRDMILSTSGALTPRIGGPGVHPPQPAGVYSFTQNTKNWPETTGPDRYRRTLYTMFYRSAPYPLLTTFDSPEFSTVCTRRSRSNTPLQALAVANDPMFIELSQKLAARVLQETATDGDIPQRVRRMFRLCLIREPSSSEQRLLVDYWNRQFALYTSDAESASKLSPSDTLDSPAAEVAAWVSLARLLFNTDEFLTRN